MIKCYCGNKITHLVVIAHQPNSTLNRSGRPMIVANGLHIVCGDCAKKTIDWWYDHNEGRNEPYLIENISINVFAKTKKDFVKRIIPQIIKGFENVPPGGWYIGKSNVMGALSGSIIMN